MRIFITGDTHGMQASVRMKLFRRKLKKELKPPLNFLSNYLIICGDFGMVWGGGKLDEVNIREMYRDFPLTVLWVDGNHENFDALEKYPVEDWNGGKVHRITDRVLHLKRGEIFTLGEENQVKFLAFGGARSIDRGPATGDYRFWWPQEIPTWDEKQHALSNLSLHGNKVDYIIAHDGPLSYISKQWWYKDTRWWKNQGEYALNEFLEELINTAEFKSFYFGHHHKNESFGKLHCLYDEIVELHPEGHMVWLEEGDSI